MLCSCEGLLDVIRIEEPPKELKSHEKLVYNRVYEVECLKYGNKDYSQPYDCGMSGINIVKNIKDELNKKSK
ncbi:hypothetical protein bwei_1706 [Bacillus mycoides]|uniref:hypothetical protein n=1 Tax=Bacillus mycoides TaxID=1405 RepID=UPI0001A04420|nr:hypothetical protein [Bacillus mycoides]AIW84353.1 hypothetical protein bwei_1706 [Bacillus mycoides]EEL06151.1 hypothetical protein bcere0014_22480 [Bacillus cereus BDRD-ST196]GAE42893.1 hypothetical protein BW1_076_00480 [Bacillus mycoides NBRC 101238 = DSM 11821]HDR7595299.1 hypothetical protein [Bacillus mycoides]